MDAPVKLALEQVEHHLMAMATHIRGIQSQDLVGKITATSEANKAIKALATLRTALAGGNVGEIKEDQGPDPDRPAANMQEAIEIRNTNSARIKRALFDINNARKILSSIIPGTDKAIVALNRPNYDDQEIKNEFRGTIEKLQLIVTTNGGAHVVTVSKEGIYSLTHSNFWKMPATKTTQEVAPPVEYKDGKFVPSSQ